MSTDFYKGMAVGILLGVASLYTLLLIAGQFVHT